VIDQPIGRVIRVQGAAVDVLMTPTGDDDAGAAQRRHGRPGSYVSVGAEGELRLIGVVTSAASLPVDGRPDPTQPVLSCQLVGTIRDGTFRRGMDEAPSIGDPVRPAGRGDFAAIFESFSAHARQAGEANCFCIGRFALEREFPVEIRGSEFFSKHVAVVGNSGSGKSCTTTRILQEVLRRPEAQVVLFDLHGEYRQAFSRPDGTPDDNVVCLGAGELILPYWLLRYHELEALVIDHSTPGTVSSQIAFLKLAIQQLRRSAAEELGIENSYTLDTPIFFDLAQLLQYAENLNEARYVTNSDRLAFANLALRNLDPAEQQTLLLQQRCVFNRGEAEGERPDPLFNGSLVGLINLLQTRLNDRRFDFMLRPIQQAKRSEHFRDALKLTDSPGTKSQAIAHLLGLLTGGGARRTNLTIVDMSGIPHEVVDIVVAVFTRLLFDHSFWAPDDQRHPILLVYEEAHNYVPRTPAEHTFAARAVERVAKEGRKYGVGAMVISQRPTELSETVMSQCNGMVVMRLNNPDDQHYVERVVGDQFADFVRMLPNLRPGEAFVLGEGVLMPMQTQVELPDRQPRSADVDFFGHWSRARPSEDMSATLHRWWTQQRQEPVPIADEAEAEVPVATVAPTVPAGVVHLAAARRTAPKRIPPAPHLVGQNR